MIMFLWGRTLVMGKFLRVFLLGFSMLALTACFDLVAQSKYVGVEKDSMHNNVVLGPATTSDGDLVIYTIVSLPAHGTLDTSRLPEVSYTPENGYAGKDLFTFKLGDGEEESNVARIMITVTAPKIDNQVPTARISTESDVVVSEGSIVSLSGATSDDDDGSIVSYEWLDEDTLMHSGILYDANLSAGSHTITLRVTDDKNATGEDTIEIVVNPLSE